MQECLSLLHYMVSHQEHPWKLLAKIFLRRRSKSKSDDLTALLSHYLATHVSSPFELISSNEEHLSYYPEASKQIVVFDKYQDISAKIITGCNKLV